jgi:antitoxin FitA
MLKQSTITLIASMEEPMSSITIRKLDPFLKERLRVRAAEHGRSMEAEVRSILKNILEEHLEISTREKTGADLIKSIRARFAPFGFIEIEELPSRAGDREPPKFD